MKTFSFAVPKSKVAGRILGVVVLLTTALSSGAVIGIANASGTNEPATVRTIVAQAPPAETLETVLAIAEAPVQTQAPAPAAPAAPRVAAAGPTGKKIAAPVLNLVIPGLSGSAGGSGGGSSAVKCSRFDDAKINWLLEQVAKTKAEQPELAAGANNITAELQGALGKNMCAKDAQVIINRLCDDPAVVKVMNQMVSQLPFFIKPMIGNPCTADLVSVLNKAGKFVPGLSSDPT